MKLFAVKINDSIGSFAPEELLKKTRKEIKELIKVLENEKNEEKIQTREELKKAKFLIIEIKNPIITEEEI